MAMVKIGDLTLRQFFNHCSELTDGCDNCPFEHSDLCTFIAYHYQEEQLDEEVELHESEGESK